MATPWNVTRLTARVRVLTNIRNTSRLSDAEILDALNEAQEEVTDIKDWPQLLSKVVD